MDMLVLGAAVVGGFCISLYYQRKYYLSKIFHLKKEGLPRRRTRKREDFKSIPSDLNANEMISLAEAIIKSNRKGK